MIRDLGEDFAVLQSGYWRVEADLARPRIVSLRADPGGKERRRVSRHRACDEASYPLGRGRAVSQWPCRQPQSPLFRSFL